MRPSNLVEVADDGIAGKDCREGAVLVLLIPSAEGPAVVLTKRPSTLRDHAGQISFPGGSRDAGETLQQTAFRECEEELGIPKHSPELIGQLTPIYIPPSNFCVHPFVATVPGRPNYVPSPAEVEQVIEAPVEGLLDPENLKSEDWVIRKRWTSVPYFDVYGHKVWGATAAMLAELVSVIQSPPSGA